MMPSYPNLLEELGEHGQPMQSRYGAGREWTGRGVVFSAGELVTRKGINDALGFMELVQTAAGIFDLEAIKRVAPKANAALFTPNMAYGPRMGDQVPRILEALKDDPWSRQCVLFIARPEDGPTSAMPCTLTMQFLLREGRLDCITSMRSWDATRGLAYDIVFQGGLVMLMARCLGVRPGMVVTNAGSLHLYEDQTDRKAIAKDRRFYMAEDIPKTWPEIRAWGARETRVMLKIPQGIVVEEYDMGWVTTGVGGYQPDPAGWGVIE